jgi:hypothetical protein
VVAPLAVAGCSLGADEEPQPAPRAANEVAQTVFALERATRDRDFARICDELFTAAARRRAGGRNCARLLRSAARDVRRPSIRVLAISLKGDRATVRVRTRAAGQPPIDDRLKLVREQSTYRIEALGD